MGGEQLGQVKEAGVPLSASGMRPAAVILASAAAISAGCQGRMVSPIGMKTSSDAGWAAAGSKATYFELNAAHCPMPCTTRPIGGSNLAPN